MDLPSTRYPVAIVGIAFRFPGDLHDECAFWDALAGKSDLIGRIPPERWATEELRHDKHSEPGRSITFSAGVLSRIDEFDADFFGIAPREALSLDPQQRLLLELSWEAMENAGIAPISLAGSDCAVYVGISSTEYGTSRLDDLSAINAYSITGTTTSLAANRISYVFDLRGPSLAVDSACSSSLVALHHACACLRTGEASTALVGGVSLLLHPSSFIGFTKASMLSAEGRCKPFDAAGDGYVRAEGGAVVLLKPLDQAIAAGDAIQAVILASGVNTDGGRKTGITVPSGEAQAELLRNVLAKSGLTANDMDFVEAHGTGTAVGDPIEALAIGTAYGRKRHTPLPIGSVKGNLGHLEPASGMAGLIKTMLALKRRTLPPTLHFNVPNPQIDFSGLNLDVATECRPLEKEAGRPLNAGVNSFGFGGSNVHVIVQEYQPPPAGDTVEPILFPPLFLSAHSDAALNALARRYAELLRHTSAQDFYDLAHTAAHGRERLGKRLGLLADSPDQAAAMLSAYAAGNSSEGIVVENAPPQNGGVAFVYSGNGTQWTGMGRGLLAESSRFGEILAWLDAMIAPQAGFSVKEELLAGEDARLDNPVVVQPILFVMQVAITILLRERGVRPAAVTGHSVGEVAAAWAAGELQIEEAIRVIVARSGARGGTLGKGAMAAVTMTENEARSLLEDRGKGLDVTIAAINSPNMITLSGNRKDLERLHGHLEGKGVFFRFLYLDYAFHSRHMDGLKAVLLEELKDLRPVPEHTARFVSTVHPEDAGKRILDAAYWGGNVREPVQFHAAINRLAELGCRVFIEIGPDAVMQRYMRACLKQTDVKARVLPSLRKKNDSLTRIDDAAMRAHLLADGLDSGVFFPRKGKRVKLPNYPWQRERYWLQPTSESPHLLERRRVHPLLGWSLPEAETTWENSLDPTILPWLADHMVGGAIVFPAAAYAEMALAAAGQWLRGKQPAFEELEILAPMVFNGEHARTLRFILNPRDGGFQIRSRQRLRADPWTLHASGRILESFRHPAGPAIAPVPEPAKNIAGEEHYRLAAALGLAYGPAFQGLAYVRVAEDRLEGSLTERESADFDTDYALHPARLDLCFQSLIDFFHAEVESNAGMAFLPVKIGRLTVHQQDRISGFRARLRKRGRRSMLADFELLGTGEKIIASMADCRFRAALLHRPGNVPPGIWCMIPHLSPHPAEHPESCLPASETLAKLCRESLAGFEVQRRKWFRETLPLLEALALVFTYESFQKITKSSPEALNRLMNASSAHICWLGALLQREGLLVRNEKGWQMAESQDLPNPADLWRTLLDDSPASLARLAMLGGAGLHLPELLEAQMDDTGPPPAIVHPPLLEMLANDPTYLGIQRAIANILRHLAESGPENRRLRILEITARISPHPYILRNILPEDRFDYVFVHADEEAEQRTQTEYGNAANVVFARINHDNWRLISDKALPECFDLVVIDQVLHRALDPLAALEQSRKWLVRGGALLLAEQYPDWNADFLHGLDPGWWRKISGNDDTGHTLRSSLRAPETWRRALTESGYEDVVCFTEPEAGDLTEGAYLLIAKRPHDEVIAPPPQESASWLLVADKASSAMAEHIRMRLEARGQGLVVAGSMREADLAGLDHVVHCSGWNRAIEDAPDLLDQLLSTVQGLGGPGAKAPRLWMVTQGGALVSDPPPSWMSDPVQTAVWGFGRVVMNEYPAMRCTLIDLACGQDGQDMPERLGNELLHPDGADEIVLAAEGRYTLALVADKAADNDALDGDTRFYLDFRVPGQLRNLLWLPGKTRPLREGLIEARTKATGLNFRDVMFTLGLLPEESVENGFAGGTLGLEFSGIVTRVGAGVDHIRPGDAVMGFGSSCFASHVVTSVDAVMPIPEGWSFEAAATVPTVFFTAYYALKYLADLQPGESVLIHGGAGGVGMAAIQLARHLGVTVFATAGSNIKRDFVRLLGADHVFDSRDLAFEEEILARTKGEGVDVVLNSLAGEAIRRNLRILKPFGRFLELGKRDFVENTPLGLRLFKNNISYFGIDVDQLLINRPKLAAKLLAEVMALFHQKILTPLPWRSFPAEQVEAAFRCMQQAHHIGKVVVSMADARPTLQYPAKKQEVTHFAQDSTWLISGGLSGFGLATARWLAARGVGHIVLLGRRGSQAREAVQAAEELATQGVEVKILACDVADKAALSAVIEDIRTSMPPLKGVVHAAMVMDDRLMANMDERSIQDVLRPKLLGAWHLHTLTLELPLEYFVLFSSITTAIGNPGQANYAAANAGLEGLTALRRHMGLPATCPSWGPIGDVGYLSRSAAVKNGLCQRLGAAPLTATEALDQLDEAFARGDGQCTVARFDWNTLARSLPSAGSRRFASLNRGQDQSPAETDSIDFRGLIEGKTKDEITDIVRVMIISEVAHILCLNAERIDPNRSLHDLGMDSLMAMELSLALEKRFATQFPVMTLNEAPSIQKITIRIIETIMESEKSDEGDVLVAMVENLARQHGEKLSSVEMERILRKS